jgi:hypothetical protein
MTDAPVHWRKSTLSASSSSCVEVAQLADGRVLVRNSNHPDAGTLTCTPAEMTAWVAGCRAGEFDDLAG